MASIRKSMRNSLKRLKKDDSKTSLMSKVLRSLFATGVFVAPMALAETAEAAGDIQRIGNTENLMQNGKANIYAEQVNAANSVGLNRFSKFNVENGELANLYFKTQTGTQDVNTLINMVQDQINIAGTVNAIRNYQVGGNLFFLSPKGMIVGSTGVINAGSLTMITPTEDFFRKAAYGTKLTTIEIKTQKQKKEGENWVNDGDATTTTSTKGEFITKNIFEMSSAEANQYLALNAAALAAGKTIAIDNAGTVSNVEMPINSSGSIVVHGKINAATAVKLVAGTVDVSKASGATSAPILKTGVAFKSIVNTGGTAVDDAKTGGDLSNGTLAINVDAEGKISIVDPSNAVTNPTYYASNVETEVKELSVKVDDTTIHTKEKLKDSEVEPTAKDDKKEIVTTTTTVTTKTSTSSYITAEQYDSTAEADHAAAKKSDAGYVTGTNTSEIVATVKASSDNDRDNLLANLNAPADSEGFDKTSADNDNVRTDTYKKEVQKQGSQEKELQ